MAEQLKCLSVEQGLSLLYSIAATHPRGMKARVYYTAGDGDYQRAKTIQVEVDELEDCERPELDWMLVDRGPKGFVSPITGVEYRRGRGLPRDGAVVITYDPINGFDDPDHDDPITI